MEAAASAAEPRTDDDQALAGAAMASAAPASTWNLETMDELTEASIRTIDDATLASLAEKLRNLPEFDLDDWEAETQSREGAASGAGGDDA